MLYLGSTVAVASNDASVKLYNIASGQVRATFNSHHSHRPTSALAQLNISHRIKTSDGAEVMQVSLKSVATKAQREPLVIDWTVAFTSQMPFRNPFYSINYQSTQIRCLAHTVNSKGFYFIYLLTNVQEKHLFRRLAGHPSCENRERFCLGNPAEPGLTLGKVDQPNKQVRMCYRLGTGMRCCILARRRHFSVWNDVMAAILKSWRQIEKPASSIDAYLREEHSDPIWKATEP